MTRIVVTAGDFPRTAGSFSSGSFVFAGETIPATELDTLEVADPNPSREGGWGLRNVHNPFGLVVAMLARLVSGRRAKRRRLAFVARFNDGRLLHATTDGETLSRIRSAIGPD